jgi:hypothetical protein
MSEREGTLVPRNELTGADRAWAAKYEPGDVLRYSNGSRKLGIQAGDHARVLSVEPRNNLLTVALAPGERIQLTAPFNDRLLD